MYSLLLAIIYLAFISLGLPDSLLGAAWPVLYRQLDVPIAFAGILTFIISCGTVLSSLMSDRLTLRRGLGHRRQRIHDDGCVVRLLLFERVLDALFVGSPIRAGGGRGRRRAE